MRNYPWIIAAATAVCLSGCALVEKVATPENLDKVVAAINAKIDDSDDLSKSGKAKLKAEVEKALKALEAKREEAGEESAAIEAARAKADAQPAPAAASTPVPPADAAK